MLRDNMEYQPGPVGVQSGETLSLGWCDMWGGGGVGVVGLWWVFLEILRNHKMFRDES